MSADPRLDATMAAARSRTIHDRQRMAGDDKARDMMRALMGAMSVAGAFVPKLVGDVQVGDEVAMAGGDWSFRVASITEGRIARGLRDERGIMWREPGHNDVVKVWKES